MRSDPASRSVAHAATAAQPRYSGATAATVVVWSATVVYAATLTTLSLRRFENLGGGFDLAIFTQYTWLLGHGLDPVNTVNGKPLFGDHVEPGLALFAPIGALGGAPEGLLVAQAVVLALVAPVLHAIGRAVRARPSLACLMPILWLVSPLTYGPNLYEFHPESAAPLFLGLAVLGLVTERTRLFVISAILAVSLKEDIALTVAMLGVVAWLLGRRSLGVVTALASSLWFVLSVGVILPAFGRSVQDEYGPRFAGDRGDSLGELAQWGVAHPTEAMADVFSAENVSILVLLVVATAGLCLLAPLWLIVAAPSLLANFASAYPPQHSIWFQYYLVPWACAALAGTIAVGVVSLWSTRLRLAVVIAAGTVAALSLPYGVQRLNDLSTAAPGVILPKKSDIRSALALALADGVGPVAVPGRLAAELAERREIYVLPAPFLGVRRGATWTRADLDERAGRVRVVIYDRTQPESPEFEALYRRIPAELRRQGFRVVQDSGLIVVFRR